MIGYYSCYACQDSWCRDLIDQEVQAYIQKNPELAESILSGEMTDVDLGEVLCDGCEQEEALAEAWDEWYANFDDYGFDEDERERMAELMAPGGFER